MSEEMSAIERLGGPALGPEAIAMLDAALNAAVRSAFDLMVSKFGLEAEVKLLWPGVSYAATKSAAMKLAELAK